MRQSTLLASSSALLLGLVLLLAQAPSSPFEGARPGAERTIANLKFNWAPAGRFLMGSPPSEPQRRSDEGPVTVTLSQGFWVARHEVTQGQWKSLMRSFPRAQDKGVGDDFPVHWVSFFDAQEFSRRLTARARATAELPDDWEIRLPTEAQWEYACRAGTGTASSFGDQLTRSEANIGSAYPGGDEAGNRAGKATPVGSYAPNAWRIFDMHGNEWEWCLDWYHRQLPGGTDPDLSTEKGEMNRDGTYSRVRRGGAWVEPGWANRSAMRLRYEPERSSDHIGFRVVAVRHQRR